MRDRWESGAGRVQPRACTDAPGDGEDETAQPVATSGAVGNLDMICPVLAGRCRHIGVAEHAAAVRTLGVETEWAVPRHPATRLVHATAKGDAAVPREPMFNARQAAASPQHAAVYARYEKLYNLIDFCAAAAFVVGSALFFFPARQESATWAFLIGSILFAARPTVRVLREFHLARIPLPGKEQPSDEQAGDDQAGDHQASRFRAGEGGMSSAPSGTGPR